MMDTKAGDHLMAFDPGLTRAAAQRAVTQIFMESGIESAALDARILVCAALEIDHAALIRDPDLQIGAAANRLAMFVSRRKLHEPVSRILGRKEFFGETYQIGPAVLDPRPDTECLIEALIAALKPRKHEALRILDLGVGSGAILGALLRQFSCATGVGIDLSPAACIYARDNLRTMGFADRAAFIVGDWLAPIQGHFDVIVSNPPYIASGDIDGLDPEVRLHDPALALDGGADGLDAYRKIIASASAFLGPQSLLAFELGDGQLAAVDIILRRSGFKPFASRRDLAGHDRVILASLEYAV